LLSSKEKEAFSFLKKGVFPENLADSSKAKIYEAYGDFLELKFQRGKIKKEAFDSLIDPILSARAKLGPIETFPKPPQPKYSPVDGHESFKFFIGKTFSQKRDYYDLGLRTAFCDLLDDDLGYIKNSQLKMSQISLRYDSENNKLFVKEFALTEIVSLNPLNDLNKDLSWSVFLGWKEYERNIKDQNKAVFSLNGGPGLSLARREKILFFALANAEFQAGSALKRGFDFGLGPKVGLKLDGEKLKFLLTSGFNSFLTGQQKPILKSEAETAYLLNKNLSIRLLLRKTPASKEAGIYLHKFFSPL
jgi:hypothetical protein